MNKNFLIVLLIAVCIFQFFTYAGPPYDTDDPEPVDFHHWEFYSASHMIHDNGGWNATMMHFEVNYGAAPNLQLHAIIPFTLNAPEGEKNTYGLGDIEIGAKYRFIQESKYMPMVGIFPLVELPTGNSSRGLGNGKPQFFLPVWIQKSFGNWTTYGGTGYLINPAEGSKNSFFWGLQIQNQITKKLSLGTEIYHITSLRTDEESETRFNLGMVFDLNEHNHILLSAGRGINGPVKVQIYIGYQITLGSD